MYFIFFISSVVLFFFNYDLWLYVVDRNVTETVYYYVVDRDVVTETL